MHNTIFPITMLLSPCSITMLLSLNILSLSLIYSITLSLSHFLHHSLTDQHSFPLFISHQTYLYTTHVSPKTHSLVLTPFSQSNSLAISIHFHTQTLSSLWVKLSSYLYPFSHSNSIHSLSQTLSILSVKLYPFSPSNSTHSFTEALFLSFSYTHTFNKLFLCFHTSPIQNGSRHVFPLSPFPLSRARSPLIFCGTHFNANSTAASIPGFKFKKWNYEKGGERGILKSSFWAVEKTIS